MESAPAEMKKVLVFGGKTGWIGGLMVELCGKEGMIDYFSCMDVMRSLFFKLNMSRKF